MRKNPLHAIPPINKPRNTQDHFVRQATDGIWILWCVADSPDADRYHGGEIVWECETEAGVGAQGEGYEVGEREVLNYEKLEFAGQGPENWVWLNCRHDDGE